MPDLIVPMCRYRKHNLNRFEYCHSKKYLIIVNTIILTIILGNQMSFVGLHLPICTPLPLDDLLTPYGLYPFRWVNSYPYIVDLHRLHFRSHDFKPFIIVGSLHCIHIGDQILIILIEFDRISIPDQET